MAEEQRPELKRSVGLFSLTLISAGGILGSGWLFSPLLTAQLAGPASLIAWVIGAVAMLLLAFSFAEVASVLPVAGGIARIPRYTHGDITAVVIGWTAWIGYCTQAPIEVAVVIRYAAETWPQLVTDQSSGQLSMLGYTVAACMLLSLCDYQCDQCRGFCSRKFSNYLSKVRSANHHSGHIYRASIRHRQFLGRGRFRAVRYQGRVVIGIKRWNHLCIDRLPACH